MGQQSTTPWIDLQISPLSHLYPHPPQLDELTKLASQPSAKLWLQSPRFGWHARILQPEFEHPKFVTVELGRVHLLLHAPQLLMSFVRLISQPVS